MYELFVKNTDGPPVESIGLFYSEDQAVEYYSELVDSNCYIWGYKVIHREDLEL